MDYLSISLIALGLAMDAFAVSVTNGMVSGRFNKTNALKLGLGFGFFQMLMPVLGWLAGIRFKEEIAAVDHWIAFGLLSVIGVKMIVEAVKDKSDTGVEKSAAISFKMLLGLSIATSIDALAVGVTFAFTDIDTFGKLMIASFIIGVITLFLSLAGYLAGSKFGGFLKNKAEIFGGVILIGIGVKILIEHLFFS